MLEILTGLNYSAIIITTLVSFTTIRGLECLRSIARIWLEGLRTEREIEAMRHGCQPGGHRK